MQLLVPQPNNELGPAIPSNIDSHWLPYAISASFAITASYAVVANYAISASYIIP